MATARVLLNEALKDPMLRAGWTPKSAGWFVRPASGDTLAVVASSVATAHARPGEGLGTVHLGIRIDSVERTVARLLDMKDDGYRSRTATVPIGHATSKNRWREWQVSASEVDTVAREIAQLVAEEGWPYLCALVDDADALLGAVHRSPSIAQSAGFARVVVLLGSLGRKREAQGFIESRVDEVASRSDPAAQDLRRAAESLRSWLDEGVA